MSTAWLPRQSSSVDVNLMPSRSSRQDATSASSRHQRRKGTVIALESNSKRVALHGYDRLSRGHRDDDSQAPSAPNGWAKCLTTTKMPTALHCPQRARRSPPRGSAWLEQWPLWAKVAASM